MPTDCEQLAFDVDAPGEPHSPPPAPFDKRVSATCAELTALAHAADVADSAVEKCRLLVKLAEAVDGAFLASIGGAYTEHGSWRKLSAVLEIPFQTLHRRYASVVYATRRAAEVR